eukprot:ANDGO_06847.mRNA.1 hypothetical protein
MSQPTISLKSPAKPKLAISQELCASTLSMPLLKPIAVETGKSFEGPKQAPKYTPIKRSVDEMTGKVRTKRSKKVRSGDGSPKVRIDTPKERTPPTMEKHELNPVQREDDESSVSESNNESDIELPAGLILQNGLEETTPTNRDCDVPVSFQDDEVVEIDAKSNNAALPINLPASIPDTARNGGKDGGQKATTKPRNNGKKATPSHSVVINVAIRLRDGAHLETARHCINNAVDEIPECAMTLYSVEEVPYSAGIPLKM